MTIQHEKRREHRASITSRGIVPWFAALVLVLVGAAGCRKTDVASSQAMRTDQQIATDIQAKYASESALNGQNVQVAVQSGVATLNGTVTDNASRALAGNDAGSVAGVKTVVNDLTVVSAAAVSVPPPIPPQQAVVEMDRRPLSARDSSMRPVPHRQRFDQSRQPAVQAQAPLPQPAQVAEEAAVIPAVPAPSVVQAPVETPRPERPAPVTVTLVPGTVVPVRITESLDSGQTQPGEVFHGTLAEDLIAGGMVAVPRGANIVGRVVDARDAGHFSGSSLLSIQLTEINAHGQTIAVATDTYTKQGQARGSNTAKKAGGGAALGAIIGAIAGGGKGAAIGAAAGGGIGAGANGVTRGQQVQIMPETLINFRLQIPAAVTTSRKLGSPQTDEQDVPRPTLQQR